jgi:hypothetical protein
MRAALHAWLVVMLLMVGGCVSSPTLPESALPDGRDLSEDPLDITKLPQP